MSWFAVRNKGLSVFRITNTITLVNYHNINQLVFGTKLTQCKPTYILLQEDRWLLTVTYLPSS